MTTPSARRAALQMAPLAILVLSIRVIREIRGSKHASSTHEIEPLPPAGPTVKLAVNDPSP
jgi:hypothetical protein